jgi:hypothetical protein
MAELSRYQKRQAVERNKRARQTSPYTAVSPVVGLPVSAEELVMLTNREIGRVNRPNWAKDVLSLVQSKPNEWIKLAGKHNPSDATRYLKPLGIKYACVDSDNKSAVVYVKWEVK